LFGSSFSFTPTSAFDESLFAKDTRLVYSEQVLYVLVKRGVRLSMEKKQYPPHIQEVLDKLPEGFVPDPSSPLFEETLPAPVPVQPKEYNNPWIPKRCVDCRYRGHDKIPSAQITIPSFVCLHPQTSINKGGVLLLMHDDAPSEDCAFVAAEEKYKDRPLRRWIARLVLRLARRANFWKGTGRD